MLLMERLPRETGREFALRNLRENIINLQLEPGVKISENELAAEMGLSRTPVREALMELSKVHIVEIYPQKGSAVTLIDDNQVEESLFLREVLERAVLTSCCEVATEEDIRNLKAQVDLQRFYVTHEITDHDFLQLDNQFHETLFTMAGKPNVFAMMRNMNIHLDRIRTLSLSKIPRDQVTREHAEIVGAIVRKDATAARNWISTHVRQFHTVDEELHLRFASYYK